MSTALQQVPRSKHSTIDDWALEQSTAFDNVYAVFDLVEESAEDGFVPTIVQ